MKYLSQTPYLKLKIDPWVDDTIFHTLHRITYRRLRFIMMIVAITIPVVFLMSAVWVGMQESISAFYHTPMRDIFVGVIFAMGMCLLAYKGYNPLEDTCLNAASLFLFVVAIAPTDAPLGSNNWDLPIVHKFCAFVFFALIAVVCWYGRKHGLQRSGNTVKFYGFSFESARKFTSLLMVFVIIGAILLFICDKIGLFKIPYSTFVVETAALLVFALYWQIVSSEMKSLE